MRRNEAAVLEGTHWSIDGPFPACRAASEKPACTGGPPLAFLNADSFTRIFQNLDDPNSGATRSCRPVRATTSLKAPFR